MKFAQRRNRLTTHFSEIIPVVRRRMTVFYKPQIDTAKQPFHSLINHEFEKKILTGGLIEFIVKSLRYITDQHIGIA